MFKQEITQSVTETGMNIRRFNVYDVSIRFTCFLIYESTL